MTTYDNTILLEKAKSIIQQLTSLDVEGLGDNILTVGPVYSNGKSFYKFKRQLDKHDHYHVDSKIGYLYRIPFNPLNTNEEIREKRGKDSFIIPVSEAVLLYDLIKNVSYFDSIKSKESKLEIQSKSDFITHKIEFKTLKDGSVYYLNSDLTVSQALLYGVKYDVYDNTLIFELGHSGITQRFDSYFVGTSKEEVIEKLNQHLKNN